VPQPFPILFGRFLQTLLSQLFQDRFDLSPEIWQFAPGDPPHDVEIDPEILMHQYVAHIHDI